MQSQREISQLLGESAGEGMYTFRERRKVKRKGLLVLRCRMDRVCWWEAGEVQVLRVVMGIHAWKEGGRFGSGAMWLWGKDGRRQWSTDAKPPGGWRRVTDAWHTDTHTHTTQKEWHKHGEEMWYVNALHKAFYNQLATTWEFLGY